MEEFVNYGYFGLFAAAFLAATILPVGSEPLFAMMIAMDFDIWLCLLFASVGNWLGGMTNYWLGRLGKIEWAKKYLKMSPEKFDKLRHNLAQYGAGMAFFSFLPLIGDLIAFGLGYVRAKQSIVGARQAKHCRFLYAFGQGLSLCAHRLCRFLW